MSPSIAFKARCGDVVSRIGSAFALGLQVLSGTAPQFGLLAGEAVPSHEIREIGLEFPHLSRAVVTKVGLGNCSAVAVA